MDFGFSPEQDQFRMEMRRFARTEFQEGYKDRAKADEFPWEELGQLAQVGILGLGIPEQYGGQGEIDPITFGIAAEEISYADFNLGFMPLTTGLVGQLIVNHASDSVKEEWLPQMTAGTSLFSFALTEPHAGSDATKIKCRADRTKGGWILNGEKTSITLAAHGDACVVFCRTDGEPGSAKGVTALMVPLDQEGVSRTRFRDTGMIPIGRGSLFFDDVFVPEENLLGEEGMAFHMVMHEFDFTRAALGLMCVGAAKASVDEAVTYAKEREAFGKPIVQFEGVSFQLAEHFTFLEAARWLAYRTLWLREAGEPHTAEAAMCKWWIPKRAGEVIHDCLIIHGHGGYSDDFPLEQRMRDVLGLELGDGTANIQKLIIAREKIGRVALPY